MDNGLVVLVFYRQCPLGATTALHSVLQQHTSQHEKQNAREGGVGRAFGSDQAAGT